MSYDESLMNEITDGLFIGSLWALRELQSIPGGPWTIVSLLHATKLHMFLETAMNELHRKGLVAEHFVWNLQDSSDSTFLESDSLPHALACIDRGNQILVHCAFGVSRSAALCAAWLISRRRCPTLAHAMDMIRAARPSVNPKAGFLAELRALEQCGGNVERARVRLQQNRGGG